MLSLPIHLSIHIFFALLAGFIVWLFFRKSLILALLGGLLGGFMVDFDHFIDYFFAFGWNFNFYWFSKGYEFLKSDRIFLLFHGWEYIALILIIAVILKKRFIKSKIFLFSLAIGLLFHLSGDIIMNEGMRLRSYSILYRVKSGFKIEKLVTPEHYRYNVLKKEDSEIKKVLKNN